MPDASAPTRAVAVLRRAGIAHQLHRYDHDPDAPSFGTAAANLLGLDGRRVLKTLVVDVDGALAVAVTPVVANLDLKALALALAGKRAALAEPAAAERATGYVLGGISPLGQRRRLRTVVDQGAVGWPTVFVSGGRRGLEIELAPADLVAATEALVARISAAG